MSIACAAFLGGKFKSTVVYLNSELLITVIKVWNNYCYKTKMLQEKAICVIIWRGLWRGATQWPHEIGPSK